MAEWKTLKQETMEAGGNNFIEVNVKQPPEGKALFIGISKGWFSEDGQKRYKSNILVTREKKKELLELLEKIDSGL